MGYVSYPLYLVHENAMVSITISLGQSWQQVPAWLLPLLPLALLSALAYWIADALKEKYLKRPGALVPA